MISTNKDDITADEEYLAQTRELAKAVAELSPRQLFHWTNRKLKEVPEGSGFRRILKDLQFRVGKVLGDNQDNLNANQKPNHKVHGHGLFVMYQLVRETQDEQLPELKNEQEAEHLRRWFRQLEELILFQNLPMIWSWSDRKSLDFPSFGLSIDLDMAMHDNPSTEARRMWKDMLDLVEVLGSMSYASYSFKQFLNQSFREHGKLLNQQ